MKYPDCVDPASVSFLFQDESVTVTGGGVLRYSHRSLMPDERLFLTLFFSEQKEHVITLREILYILWCLKTTTVITRVRIIFVCDN